MRVDLKVFESDAFWKQFSLQCKLAIEGTKLILNFDIFGPLETLLVHSQAQIPKFRDNLWKETCFELFCARPNENSYREFNLSPSGDWAVYDFRSYRVVANPKVEGTPQSIVLGHEVRQCACKVELGSDLLPAGCASWQDLEFGIAAVLELRNGQISHWAPSHPKPVADFHYRANFKFKI